MHIEIAPVIFLLFYLRKFMRENSLYPEWDKRLSNALVISAIIFVMQITMPGVRGIAMWLCFAAVGLLANLILTKEEFTPVKPVLNAVLPYIAITFLSEVIKIVSNSLYSSLSGYISTGKTFALLWMFAMWFIINRQRKALDNEKKKNEKIEKEIQITESLKAALEVQVAERTAALTLQTEELQHALDELKTTQKQLIHAEKMASLGELTAGIAHEIQNPLNFVNNFSEVSIELVDELKVEIDRIDAGANTNENITGILNDLVQNQQKINYHGKRADSIVKGMLQHSRTGSGQKEEADINVLADEYLRLSYHGLRAKDKLFNAKIETSFDESIPKIRIMLQDVGRVLLNLYTNAFYSVMKKNNQAGGDYQPLVSVSTKKAGGQVEIRVRDNGIGIPQNVLDKIYNPFFTTKPAGEGTGLGLSLSYEIITKGHGGTITADTKEGEFAEFIIKMPLK